MATLWQDVKYGFRILCKNLGFTGIALVTLAVGIGANTIMFSVVNMLMFRPMQVEDPDRLVYCGARFSNDRSGAFGYEMYTSMRDDNAAFSDLIAFHPLYTGGTWVRGSDVRQTNIMYTSANYFSALGVDPIHGRTFLPEEERYGAELVGVLSYRMWKELGGNPGIVGQIAHINTMPCRIIGVAPKGFTGTTITGPDIWMPLGTYVSINERYRQSQKHYPYLLLIGRLKPDLDMMAAEARLQVLIPRLKEMNRFWREDPKLQLYLARLGRIEVEEASAANKRYRAMLSMAMMGISSVILLIACLNLANMLNVQGTERQREIAIRLAIGGGRLRIIGQLLIESLLLALLGGATAIIPTWAGIRMLNAWMAVIDRTLHIPVSFDVRVFGVTLGSCLIATLLFGLQPALNLSKRDVIGDLKDAGAGVIRTTRRRWRLVPRGLAVMGQIALSVAFVMVAMLFVRTALKVAYTCPGFDLRDKIVVKIDALDSGYTPAQAATACEMLAERLKGTSGIRAVGWSRGFPVGHSDPGLSEKIMEYKPGVEDDNASSLVRRGPLVFRVRGDYFEAMGISLLRGRPFQALDSTPEAERVVIIDERLAHRLRGDGDVLGCLIQHGWGSELQVCRVVGVVPALRDPSGEDSDWTHIYEPIPIDEAPVYMHIRTSPRMESSLLRSLGPMFRQIDPELEVVSVTSLADCHRRGPTVQGARMSADVTTAFGVLAMFLAGLGLYAIMGHMVAARTREIGLRMALGASRRSVLALVFRQNGVSTLAGLVLGILLAMGVTSLVRSALCGISPTDPLSMAATVIVLAATSLLAGYLPARRAVRVDPMTALRYE
jgi:predicted permease